MTLKTDLRPWKKAMHALIDDKTVPINDLAQYSLDCIRKHRVFINAPQFANQIAKLVHANNRSRAHKLVECLSDFEYGKFVTYTAAVLGLAGFLALTYVFRFM